MLGVVLHLHVTAERPLTRVEGQRPGQDLEQRRLPRPVDTHQRHAIAALDQEVHSGIDHVVAVRLAHPGEPGHQPAGARRLGKREVDAARLRLGLDALHPVEHLDPALHLPGLARLVAEPVDEALDLGHPLGLVARLRLPQGLPGLALHQEVVVVAVVERDRAPRQLRDRGDHAVQEVAVVRDDDHAALVGGEEVLEPPERLEIQVVGGLVEQQQIGPQQQEPRQRRAHAPAARELGERPVHLLRREPEPAQDDLGLGLEPVAAEGLEPVLDLAVGVGQSGVGAGACHAGRERLELALEAPDLVEARERLRQHGAVLAGGDLLREVADGDPGVTVDPPRVGLLHQGEDAAERGLPGPVRPDQADPLTPPDAPRAVLEQLLTTVALGDPVESDHAYPIVWTRSGVIL